VKKSTSSQWKLLVVSGCLAAFLSNQATADDAARNEFFEQKIRPVLVEKCYGCHSGDKESVEASLWLDSKAGWEKGGQSGPAVVPGNPEASLLMHVIRWSDKKLVMPPDEKLPDSVIRDFEYWIEQGAYDPRQGDQVPATLAQTRELTEKERWAYSPPSLPQFPAVVQEAWIRQPVDLFILSKLEGAGLAPAPEVEPAQLARRLYFDLTGLPPTIDEVKAFVAAADVDRQKAVENLVDDLLARPAYGVKWARYWLDCVRYADSLDARFVGGGDITDAWRYRDWVVNAFNNDLPYREFVRDQIAGDILANQQWNPDQLIATGVYAIGNWGNGDSDKQKVHTDIVDDQVDLTTRAFLGLTLACARCHDHKFDPLSTGDYYSMAGFFFSSHILEQFASPTAGETIMRVDVLSPEQKQERNALLAQIAEYEQQLSQVMEPLTFRHSNVGGHPSLVSWSRPGETEPSFTVNSSGMPVSFATILLPGESVCVHPGPQTPATIAWKAPVSGEVLIAAEVADVDPTCGDGFAWSLHVRGEELQRGDVGNGGSKTEITATCVVQAGELVRLVISPRGDYFCDSTQIDLTVRHAEESWNLTETALRLEGGLNVESSPFIACAGTSSTLQGDEIDRNRLVSQLEEARSRLPAEFKCQGMLEGGIAGTKYAGFHDAQIHIRGNYNRLSVSRPRTVPAVFESTLPPFEGSGRLELAEWIASDENPLTARVMVNRLWQHHFGRGIVATPNNFGKLGADATHPELLDWMAITFVEKGWSIKEMHRMICTSATYQQSTIPGETSLQLDPDNQLYSRQQSRKLTAEELRDSLLAVAGNLDQTLGGKGIPDLASPRRTLYLTTVRSDRSSYQMLFDGADPTSIIDQRTDSLVAPQALWMLNQPFSLNLADRLAEEVRSRQDLTEDQKLELLINRVYSRSALEDERRLLADFLAGQTDASAGWKKLCHVLLCSNEFLFID